MITTTSSPALTPFRQNRFLQILLGLYVLLWIIMAIRPVYPTDWAIENVLVVLFAIYVWRNHRSQPFSELSYLLIFIFMALYSVGAHYTYAETPMGFWMQDWFGWDRNNYDRVVHASFGLLLTYPLREYVIRHSPIRGRWLFIMVLALSVAASGIYELIEWAAVLIVSPEAGEAYLGTQGDEFDAQKDMVLASFGALVCLLITQAFSDDSVHE